MNAWEAKHQMKLAEWQARVTECRSSGLSVTQWCKAHQLSSKTYYHWEREVLGVMSKELVMSNAKTASEEVEFAAIPETVKHTVETAAILQLGEIRVEIHNGANSDTIQAIITALKTC